MKRLFNFFRDHIIEYLFMLILIGGVFYLAIFQGSYARPLPRLKDGDYYANLIFDQSRVHKIEIEIASDRLESLLESPGSRTKYPVDVIIDGEKFANVAFSTRGNASLNALVQNDDTDRYSYKINFKKFNSSMRYHGLDKLVLNNLNSDPSYLRDYVAYEMMRANGVYAPLTSFTELYINGELKGLYQAVEDVDESFLARNSFPKNTVLYKPEALAIDYNYLHKLRESLPEGETIDLETDSLNPNFDYGGSDLVYISDDPADYPAIFSNAITKTSPRDKLRLIEGLKSLSDVSLENPEKYWDINAIANYFAVSNFVISTDSYIGSTAHNYYLVSVEGKNAFIPWDYNLAFQGLWFDERLQVNTDIVNWSIDEPLSEEAIASRPAWQLIAKNPDYQEKYRNAVQNLIDSYILNGDARKKIDDTVELIRPYVEADPTRFVSIEEFNEGVEIMRDFLLLRTDAVQRQLWGLPPNSSSEIPLTLSGLEIIEEF